MQLHIKGHHVELTPALKELVESKMQKVERHFPHITNVEVILNVVGKNEHKAEAELSLPSSKNKIFAEATSENMYKSIDGMISKLDAQVRKHKEKLNHHDDDIL